MPMAVALTEGVGSALLPCSGEVRASSAVVRMVTQRLGADRSTAMSADASAARTLPRALVFMGLERSARSLNLHGSLTLGRFRSAQVPRSGCPAVPTSHGRALAAEGRTARADLAAALG